MTNLISNEYRTCSINSPSVMEEVNEARGYDLDPLDLLITLENRADTEWRKERSTGSRKIFVNRYVRSAIANL